MISPSRGQSAVSGDILGLGWRGEVYNWHLLGRDMVFNVLEGPGHPLPLTKNDLAQTVNTSEAATPAPGSQPHKRQ